MEFTGASIAYGKVQTAIARGALRKLDGSIACVDCEAPASCYDHRDYNFPLQVEAVCSSCNKKRGSGKPLDKDSDIWIMRAKKGSTPPFVQLAEGTKAFLVREWTCRRKKCRHSWYSRKPGKPLRCAKCKSPYWDKSTVRTAAAKN